MTKTLRITLGSILTGIGVIFFILPGSILFLLAGLFILSVDVPVARNWLKVCQSGMSRSARRLDSFLLGRKLKR